jgi:hypothetical protein
LFIIYRYVADKVMDAKAKRKLSQGKLMN